MENAWGHGHQEDHSKNQFQSRIPRGMLAKRAQFININNFNTNGRVTPAGLERSCRDFCGTCYNCGWKAHSQNFCPLKECTICRKWGHAERVCYHRKDNNSLVSNMNESLGGHINLNPNHAHMSKNQVGFCPQLQESKSLESVDCSGGSANS